MVPAGKDCSDSIHVLEYTTAMGFSPCGGRVGGLGPEKAGSSTLRPYLLVTSEIKQPVPQALHIQKGAFCVS